MIDVRVPDARVPLVDRNGLPTRAFYVFLQSLFQQAGGGQITDVDLEAVTFLARALPPPAPAQPPPDAIAAMSRAPAPAPQDMSAQTFRQPASDGAMRDRLALAELALATGRPSPPTNPGNQLSVYTVAKLPKAGVLGRIAAVSDATAPTYLGALVGGGAVKTPVFDNGTAWVSF